MKGFVLSTDTLAATAVLWTSYHDNSYNYASTCVTKFWSIYKAIKSNHLSKHIKLNDYMLRSQAKYFHDSNKNPVEINEITKNYHHKNEKYSNVLIVEQSPLVRMLLDNQWVLSGKLLVVP